MIPQSAPQSFPKQDPVISTEITEKSREHPDVSLSSNKPFFFRRPVRIAMYTGVALLCLALFASEQIPVLLDPTFEQHIQNKQVAAGMTREQVMESWGSPYQMNVSYTDKGIRREEWIFEDWIGPGSVTHRYLYFEEGILVGGWYYE